MATGIELLQKHITARDLLATIDKMMAEGVFFEMKRISGEYVHVMLKYIINAGELDDSHQLLEDLSNHLPEDKEVIMTIAQQLEQKGMQQGMLEGINNAATALLLSGKLTPEEIAETLNMSLEQVQALNTH